MTGVKDRIVLAVTCGSCLEITGIRWHHGSPTINRCGSCGRRFEQAEALVAQYQVSEQHLAQYEALWRALQEAQQAMAAALEQWGREPGKATLSAALSAVATPGGAATRQSGAVS